MAAEFVCPQCGYGRRMETGRPGESVSCPRCGAAAPARECSGRAPGSAEERVAPRSGVFDAKTFDAGAFAASRRASAPAGQPVSADSARTAPPEPKNASLPSSPALDLDGAGEPAPGRGKSLFLGLMLTLMFGGFGVFYATFPGGVMCTLMELTLFGLSVFFGENIYPALAFARLIYFMVTFAAISGHNKALARAAKKKK